MDEQRRSRRVLLICTGNIARSQMAEGWWRHHATLAGKSGRRGATWEVFSAGTRAREYVHPLAVQVMAERGIDLGGQHPKSVAGFVEQPFDLVVTLCASAEKECPVFPKAARREHWPFDDPVIAGSDPAASLAIFRRLRDELDERIHEFLMET